MEREGFPLFSGPGHIFLLYCLIAFCLFVPSDVLAKTNFYILFAGLLALGFPIGALINAIYSYFWNLIGGYVRVGHSRELYNEFKGRLSKETVLAIHDKKLWEIASGESIQYFRRRWAHYHFSAQIAVVSLLAISSPFWIKSVFALSLSFFDKPSFYIYIFSLVSISIFMFSMCRRLSKINYSYIAQLLKHHEHELREAANEEIAKQSASKKKTRSNI